MRKDSWEYKVVELKGVGLGLNMEKNVAAFQEQLNQLGKLGWELVSLAEGMGNIIAYLKR